MLIIIWNHRKSPESENHEQVLVLAIRILATRWLQRAHAFNMCIAHTRHREGFGFEAPGGQGLYVHSLHKEPSTVTLAPLEFVVEHKRHQKKLSQGGEMQVVFGRWIAKCAGQGELSHFKTKSSVFLLLFFMDCRESLFLTQTSINIWVTVQLATALLCRNEPFLSQSDLSVKRECPSDRRVSGTAGGPPLTLTGHFTSTHNRHLCSAAL